MKKASFIHIFAATLAVAVISSVHGFAQDLQVAGDAEVTSGRVSASNGKYTTFQIGSAPGVTSTLPPEVTSGALTVTGTVARLRVSASGVVATTTATITSTVDRKSLQRFKLADKDLLSLILGSSNVKGFQVVMASQRGALTGGNNLASTADTRYYVGALRTGGGELILINENFGTSAGVVGYSDIWLVESRDDKGNVRGLGEAGVFAQIPNPGVTGVALWGLQVDNPTRFSQTVTQNALGGVTDCTKARFAPTKNAGDGGRVNP